MGYAGGQTGDFSDSDPVLPEYLEAEIDWGAQGGGCLFHLDSEIIKVLRPCGSFMPPRKSADFANACFPAAIVQFVLPAGLTVG